MLHEFIRTVSISRREKVPLEGEGEGFTTRPMPTEFEKVKVIIDVDAIAQRLGQRACASKGGQSREIEGLVVVKHLR